MKIKISHSKPLSPTLCTVFTLTLLLSACQLATSPLPESTPTPGSVMGSQASYFMAKTMKELVDASRIIVTGKAIDTGVEVNMARNPEDVKTPDPSLFWNDRIYRIEVESYLKGDGPETFFIPHPLWYTAGPTPEELQDNIDQGYVFSVLKPLLPEAKYLLFLKEWDQGKYGLDLPEGSYYIGVIYPWIFDISNPDQVKPLYPSGSSGTIGQKSYQTLLEQIENPEATEEIPTPYP